jgi:hypothetical protein
MSGLSLSSLLKRAPQDEGSGAPQDEGGSGGQTCTVACEANERILNMFAIGPGGTFIFEEENRATFLPQR